MKSEQLFNALTDLRDDQLLEAETRLPSERAARYLRVTAAAALLAVVFLGYGLWYWGSFLGEAQPTRPTEVRIAVPSTAAAPQTEAPTETEAPPAPQRTYALAAASLPETAPYVTLEDFRTEEGYDREAWLAATDAWRASRELLRADTDSIRGLEDAVRALVPPLLAGKSSTNRVCSPLNVYLTLAILAEATEGEARQEILTLLDAPSVEILRARANAVWRAAYSDDGRLTSVLGVSLWLRDNAACSAEALRTLTADYYASIYAGPMGEADYAAAMQRWLDEQSRGLLTEPLAGLAPASDWTAALLGTVCCQAAWEEPFSGEELQTQTFHSPAGDVEHTFLSRSYAATYYVGVSFTAAGLPLAGGGTVYFLLPNEDLTAEKLVRRKGALSFFTGPSGRNRSESREAVVQLSVPVFDVSWETDLLQPLENLGVTAVFDAARADFSPLTSDSDEALALQGAAHAARVRIDGAGVNGAAPSAPAADSGALPADAERVTLTLDRPFVFLITTENDLPLFVGVVNRP